MLWIVLNFKRNPVCDSGFQIQIYFRYFNTVTHFYENIFDTFFRMNKKAIMGIIQMIRKIPLRYVYCNIFKM